jgi:HEAT repeat protein
VIFLRLFAIGAAFAAALASHALADPGGVSVATAADGALTLREGDRPVASFVPRTEKSQRGQAKVRTAAVSGHSLVEVRIPVLGDGAAREEVWIAELSAGVPRPVWWNIAGAQDADGETSLVANISEQGVEEYQTAARLSRCDGAAVRLFRRTWDFASHTFKSADPALPPRPTASLRAQRGDARMPTGKPLGGFFFSAASSSPSAVKEAARITPPTAVNDGNPATTWSTAGDGRGQLLTARSSGGFAITGLRVLPGDASNEKSYRASAKPRRLTLIFGRDPSQNVEVELAEDADGGARRFRDPFWIALPKPVASSCVTVVVSDVTSPKTAMSIADIDVMTELDGPDATDRLVESLSQGTSCAARQPLLVRLGAPALAKVSTTIPRLAAGGGRECLVETLAALVSAGIAPTADTVTALVATLQGSSATEERAIFKLLPTLPAPPVEAIALILLEYKRPDADRERAARLLASLDSPEARAKLLVAVGHGSAEIRRTMRAIVSRLKKPALAAVLAAAEATPATDPGRRADFLPILGALSAHETDARPAVLAALRAPLHGESSFEERARAIQGLSLVHDAAALAELIDLRAHNDDGVLRSLAVSELAEADEPTILPALRAALDDADPRVRESAAAGLGHRGDKSAADRLISGAKQEPWPEVRRAEIAALGELCVPQGNELMIRALQKDADEVRQAALVGLAHCYGTRATPLLLRVLGRLPESADMRALAARLLADRKDPNTEHALVEILSRLVAESQADISLEGVMADTAMTLATWGGGEAIAALAGLLSDARPSVQRMAVEALGLACDPGAGAAALRAAAHSRDESVSVPASAAAARCLERK